MINKPYIEFGLLCLGLLFLVTTVHAADKIDSPENLRHMDGYTVVGGKSFLSGYEPITAEGDVNVVIEIPAGTTAKWEVQKPSGHLAWEFENNKPREVNYLSYPGNYGMVPRTLLPKELGGDGDPLDVLVLGPAVPRGRVVQVKIIGVLKLLDRGEQDDKLIAVLKGSHFYSINNLVMLEDQFVGVTEIIKIWFANYKGPNKMKVLGLEDKPVADKILNSAIAAYPKK